MDIIIIGHNYAPELVGIGPYTAAMAEALAATNHRVRVICGKPSYPSWSVPPEHAGRWPRRTVENGVSVWRLPLYVPRIPHGWWRICHYLSFALLALIALPLVVMRRRPDAIVAIAPSIMSVMVARCVAKVFRLPLWVHIQDFELDLAAATDQVRIPTWLIPPLERAGFAGERASSISPRMCDRLVQRGIDRRRVVEFRNFADPAVDALGSPSPFRAEWSVDRPFVALYSGNIAVKQGIGIITEAARLLAHRRDLMFVIAGDGPNRAVLTQAAADCDNILFRDLQPTERLRDLLGLATVHILPQIAGAADLVLPSKLTNMLASGRPVIATARAGTGLAAEVEGCGIVTEPHDATALASAIASLIDDPARRAAMGLVARQRAIERWSKCAILGEFERELRQLVTEWQAERSGRCRLLLRQPRRNATFETVAK